MELIAVIILGFLVEIKWKPRVEYIQESEMWIMHYNYKNSRRWTIIWK